MDTKIMAEILNGRPYREEITKDQEEVAKASGLIVIFGASDDIVTLTGAINEEVGAWGGIEFYIRNNEFIDENSLNETLNDLDGYESYIKKLVKKDLEGKKLIKAELDKQGFSWFISSELPHETFEIFKDDDKFCRGIILNINDL